MFEEQWEEAMDSIDQGFDPIKAMNVLVTKPENRLTPGLFAKFTRYIPRCTENKLEEIRQDINRRYAGHDQEKAT